MAIAQTDLTQGSIPKKLARFAAPLVLSSVLQSAYGIVDMIVAGNFIGPNALSAINNSSTVMYMLTQIIIGLATGANILIGQYYGAKERENWQAATTTQFTFSMLAGLITAAVMVLLSRPLLILLKAPALEPATEYLQICSIGILFIFGYNANSAALRAVGNSRAPLICVICTAVMNIVLDLVFVAVLRMGTAGTALATVISQGVSFFVSLGFVLKGRNIFGLSLKKLYIRGDKLRRFLKLGIPCAVQMSVAALSWLVVTYLLNDYGIAVSAGNGIAGKIRDFCLLFTHAMCSASTAMVAQCVGAGKLDRARKVMYTCMAMTVGIAAVLILFVELTAPVLVQGFTDDPETAAYAVKNLRIEIIGQIFYASFFVYHTLALGVGNSWFAFCSSFVNCILVRLVLAIILNHFFGAEGIYWACMIAPFSSVPIGLWYERSNHWRKYAAREHLS